MKLFFKQQLSWLAFFGVLLAMLNILMFVDDGVSTLSVMYMNIIFVSLLLCFLGWRYAVDREGFQRLKKGTEPLPPYMQAAADLFDEKIQSSEQELRQVKLDFAEEQDNILAWVHEMKSPLTALKLMQEQVEPYQLKERMEGEWLRLHLLLDQRLHATRLLTMEKDNRLEPVQISSIVMKEIKELRAWCLEKGIAIEIEGIEKTVLTDAKWLAFIFRQIMTNAIKYSHAQTQINVTAVSDNEQITLIVKDEGVGIASIDLPRIFEKSYTGTIGRETSASTGMGLYLAKQAADHLHIQLKIESEIEQGTTVFLYFPRQGDYEKTFGM